MLKQKKAFPGRTAALLLAAVFTVSAASLVSPPSPAKADELYYFELPESIGRDDNYGLYNALNAGVKPAGSVIDIPAAGYTDSRFVSADNDDGINYVQADNESFITWTFDIPETALYEIEMVYMPLPGRTAPAKRKLLIDGELPFFEAANIIFQRQWTDAGEVTQDKRGNDITPDQTELSEWSTWRLQNREGVYDEPYRFALSSGTHTITLESVGESLLISEIRLVPPVTPVKYAVLAESYNTNGYKPAEGATITVQAEQTLKKSSSTLYPTFDKASVATSPSSYKNLRLNTIGNESWQYPGDWIAWEITVPVSGLYKIALRARQNYYSGFFSSRKLTIDGELPFAEAAAIRFPYNDTWTVQTLGDDENGEYRFYFEANRVYEIRLEATMGAIGGIVSETERILYDCNAIYRNIIMITNVVPDMYRDYNIAKNLPGLKEEITKQKEALSAIIDSLVALNGKRGEAITALEKTVFRMSVMEQDIEQVHRNLLDYKECLTGLGAWLLRAKNQPMQLDYILIAPPENKLPKAGAGFFAELWYGVMSFIFSYFNDYDAIGETYETDEALTVWIGVGRDQANIIKKLIDERFTVDYHIGVNLSLVNMGASLLPATLAGKGPDVAMQIGQAEIVNYAMRDAAVDLSVFEGFENVVSRFYQSAVVPFTYGGKVYGLPETQSFPMLFYRKDIMNELGITALNTWDDVRQAIPALQKRNFTFGLPGAPASAYSTYGMFLYQNDGAFYLDDGMRSGLNTEPAIEAFIEFTRFYTAYGLPTEFDFATRFRIGEIPVGIADYTMYNLLSVFAPEIEGMWSFLPIPGIMGDDDIINRSAPGGSGGSVMMNGAKNRESAWTFMKWWTDTETQSLYARELENVMGVAARYASANKDVMQNISWLPSEIKSLEAQWAHVLAIPEVPGGYYTSRQLSYAFRGVVIQAGNPRDTLYDYVKAINTELTVKRREFGLPTMED